MTNEEAIFIIENRLNTYYCTNEDIEALDKSIEALKNERPKGKWIDKDIDCYVCSFCHAGYTKSIVANNTFKNNKMNFCFNCGADMRG